MECVKCGEQNVGGVEACGRCTWPFSLPAWKSTSFWIRRITVDAASLDAGQVDELQTLERWEAEGKIELRPSDAMVEELRGAARVTKAYSLSAQPGLFAPEAGVVEEPGALAGPDLRSELEEILFPDAHPLTDDQTRDLEHLRRHVFVGGDAFVTLNVNDFVLRGRSEELRARGIWVLSPAELVTLLIDLYEWT
jgi:hypothetical protein